MNAWPAQKQALQLTNPCYRSAQSRHAEIPYVGMGTFLLETPDNVFRLAKIVQEACAENEKSLVLDVANNYNTAEEVSNQLKKAESTAHITVCVKGDASDDAIQYALKKFGRCDGSIKEDPSSCLDMYLWHHCATSTDANLEKMKKGWETIVRHKDKRIKWIGLSNVYPPVLDQFLKWCQDESKPLPDVIQLELHILCPEFELVQKLLRMNIRPMAYSPLGYTALPQLEKRFKTMLGDETGLELPLGVSYPIAMLGWNVHRGVSVIPQTLDGTHMRENLSIVKTVFENNLLFDNIARCVEREHDECLNLLESAMQSKDICEKSKYIE